MSQSHAIKLTSWQGQIRSLLKLLFLKRLFLKDRHCPCRGSILPNTAEPMKTNQITRSANTEYQEHDIANDFMLAFACQPMFQFTFDTDEDAMETLLKRFKEKIIRISRWRTEAD